MVKLLIIENTWRGIDKLKICSTQNQIIVHKCIRSDPGFLYRTIDIFSLCSVFRFCSLIDMHILFKWLFFCNSWRPSGPDLGHPVHAQGYRGPYPGLHRCRGDKSDPMVINTTRLDCDLLQQLSRNPASVNKIHPFYTILLF